MTKTKALKLFKEAGHITGVQDKPSMGVSWSLYIDLLHRDGYITDRQVQTWTNPFYN